MVAILANYKTTLAGVAALTGAVADFSLQLSSGHIDPTRLMADWTALTGGFGLIFASDATKK